MILSTAYAPPIQYFAKLASGKVLLEACEHYIKQTYRNRCRILAADGVQELSIPVKQGASEQCPIRGVRISEHNNWRARHWQTLKSCYGMAPFYEYYAPDIEPFYRKRYMFLYDFNLELIELIAGLMHLDISIAETETYQATSPEDFRLSIRPKKPAFDPYFNAQVPYYQVFKGENGTDFTPNLSIYDLLFNEGPLTPILLKKSIILHPSIL